MVSPDGTPAFGDREAGPSFRPEVPTIPADMSMGEYAALSDAAQEMVDVGRLAAAVENEQLIRRQIEHWNRRELDAWESALAPAVEFLVVPEGITILGARPAREYVAAWAGAFPDAVLEVTSLLATARGVAVEFVFRGTHNGPLSAPMGLIEPTERYVEVRVCYVQEIAEGLIRRIRAYYDTTTLMRGLGLAT
jgi:predicted ester cyclase